MENLNDYKYQKAKEQVECIKSFYTHAMVYVIVISALAYLNYVTTSFLWIVFPALGWGIGLLGHGMQAFGYMPFLGKDWEARKIREIMNSEEF